MKIHHFETILRKRLGIVGVCLASVTHLSVSSQFLQAVDGKLIDIEAGDKDNAIPRSALLKMELHPSDIVQLEKIVAEKQEQLRENLTEDDFGVKLSLQHTPTMLASSKALHLRSCKAILGLINTLPHGPLKFSKEVAEDTRIL